MRKYEIKIRKNRKFWFDLKVVKSQVLFTSIIMAFSILFAGCQKADDGSDSKEDLSYLIKTYEFHTSNNNTYKTTWTFDGYKATSYKYYENGQLYSEYKNYSYDGLNASWDYYSYNNYDINDVSVRCHTECEYLDETFRRIKYQKTQYYYPDPQNNCIYETYREYDGKKWIGYRYYKNGILIREGHDYNYDGLHCTYQITYHISSYGPNVVREERNYNVVYLDDSYLRTKTSTLTRELFHEDGTTTNSTTFAVYDYDGKKPIGSQTYVNGTLSSVSRDYQYDGLTCYYFYDTYRNGEVTSTQMYEVEYLE